MRRPWALAPVTTGGIETRLHYIRDITCDEDRSPVRAHRGARIMATLRNTTTSPGACARAHEHSAGGGPLGAASRPGRPPPAGLNNRPAAARTRGGGVALRAAAALLDILPR